MEKLDENMEKLRGKYGEIRKKDMGKLGENRGS